MNVAGVNEREEVRGCPIGIDMLPLRNTDRLTLLFGRAIFWLRVGGHLRTDFIKCLEMKLTLRFRPA